MINQISILILIIATGWNIQNIEAASWIDYTSKRANGDMKNGVLQGYSCAGYHYSEKSLRYHGPELVLSNFLHQMDFSSREFDFCSLERFRDYIYVYPKFSGISKRNKKWKSEYWNENDRKTLESGSEVGTERQISLSSVTTRKIRFSIETVLPGSEGSPAFLGSFRLKNTLVSKSMMLFPNPNSGIFTLDFPYQSNKNLIKTHNINSELISSKSFVVSAGEVSINLQENPKRIYFLKTHTNQPKFIKLIKNFR